ncbi:MAG: fibronectin type III domain-containing protein [Candidatus Zixiibacteriota bacterium]
MKTILPLFLCLAVALLASVNVDAATMLLTWTSPGDDANVGTATTYDIRYSLSPITAANWSSATQVTGEPAPRIAGSPESFTVNGLNPGTTYYFAIETADEIPNWAPISNVIAKTTLSAAPPVPTLATPANGAINVPTSTTLTWNASVAATSYRLQVATDAAFLSVLIDQPALVAVTTNLSGLSNGITYYWHVSASSSGGTSSYSATWTFTTPSAGFTAYIDSTAGAVQQPVGCDGCGTQLLKANYYLSRIDPAYTGTLDSIRIRASNNYAGPVGCFGILYGNQTSGIGAYLGRSKDTAMATVPTMANYVLHFNSGISLTAGTPYYLGVFTDSSNASSMRFAITSNTVNRTGTTGFDAPHLLVANYSTAGLAQYANQGVKQIYAIYYYHAGIVATVPAAPALVTPAAGASGVSTSPVLTWSPALTATSYHLQVATSIAFSTVVIDQPTLSGTSSTLSGLTANTVYYWRVSASNASGASPYSVTRSFTTVATVPSPPALVTPASGSSGVSTGPTLSWNASATATSYRLQVSSSATFATTIVDQSAITTTSKAISGLSGGTAYYWRVNASNAAGAGAYSAVWSFTTGVASPPLAPALASPANSATGQSVNPTFTWTASAGAVSYRVQVSTGATFGTTVIDQSNLVPTTFAVTGLSIGTTYYWRVSASNAGGAGPYSAIWSFATASGTSTNYSGATAGTVQQTVGCSGCGTQVLKANYYISKITPANSGTLDSIRIRASNNYAAATRCFGVLYSDQSNAIGGYLARTRDSARSTAVTMTDYILHFNAGTPLTAGATYYVGIFTDSTNTSSMRFAITSDAVNRTGTTGFDLPHKVVPNYTTAGLAQYANQGVKQIYVVYYYHGSAAIAAAAPGDTSTTDLAAKVAVPGEFTLSQNYPNPFNPTTRIEFNLPNASQVTLEIYNVIGEKVTTLVDTRLEAGSHSVEWNSTSESGTHVASGIYFYRLNAGDHIETKKMILLK